MMESIHLGYGEKNKVYRLYSPTHRKIVLNKNVMFDGEKIIFLHIKKKNKKTKKLFRRTMVELNN